MIFQITGYPRSGTAWLTTMFNLAPEVFAYHELAMTDPNWKQTIKDRSTVQTVGDIGTYQYFPKAVIKEARKVFVFRDPLSSAVSCERATGVSIGDDRIQWMSLYQGWLSEWQPMVVNFSDLFKIETLERIWNRCLGGKNIRFPQQKVEQLLRLNIQLHEPAKYLSDPDAAKRLAELL